MIKQYHEGLYSPIQTDGCFFMDDLSISEDLAMLSDGKHSAFSVPMVNRAYDYCIPKFMRDGGDEEKNRCYILDHVEVVRVGLYIMGLPYHHIEYLYRSDYDRMNNPALLARCNYFIKEVRYGKGSHFVRCNRSGFTLYNSGNTDGVDWLSLRGFLVAIPGLRVA